MLPVEVFSCHINMVKKKSIQGNSIKASTMKIHMQDIKTVSFTYTKTSFSKFCLIKSGNQNSKHLDGPKKEKLSLLRLPNFLESTHGWRWGCQPYQPVALYLQEDSLELISVRVWVEPKGTVRLKELGQLKNPVSWLAIETVTFRLVAQCLNQLRYRVSHLMDLKGEGKGVPVTGCGGPKVC
jgi:hypothetical protein